MADDRPGYSFEPGPPPEASRFLRTKGLAPSFRWDDVEPEEHAVAFAVAGAMWWWWILGGSDRLRDLGDIRTVVRTNRLLGRPGARDPADALGQALNDALRGAPPDAEEAGDVP